MPGRGRGRRVEIVVGRIDLEQRLEFALERPALGDGDRTDALVVDQLDARRQPVAAPVEALHVDAQ